MDNALDDHITLNKTNFRDNHDVMLFWDYLNLSEPFPEADTIPPARADDYSSSSDDGTDGDSSDGDED